MTAAAIANVAERRAMLKALGARPEREAVEQAIKAISKIDSQFEEQMEALYTSRAPAGADVSGWREVQAAKENELREAVEREKLPYKSLIQLDDLHQSYEDILKHEERALDGRFQFDGKPVQAYFGADDGIVNLMNDVFENKGDTLDLSGRSMVHIPECFGKISTIVTLDLSENQLVMLPDAVAGLINLQYLHLQSNQLKTLPDSIGLLPNLKVLDISCNQLRSLPESICRCSGLSDLKVGFNQLEYLPVNIGFSLGNLQKLDVHLNKLSALPSSVCEIKALKYLDAGFNKLRSLPSAIGNLSNLEYLDVSSNFSDLVELPDSMGDLISLKELNLSFNQIKELPESFGRLVNLKRLKLDQNPLIVPPKEVVEHSFDAIMEYLLLRWRNSLVSDDIRSISNANGKRSFGRNEYSNVWIPAWVSGSWVGEWIGSMCGGLSSMVLGGQTGSILGWEEHKSGHDFLDQQL